MRFFLLLSEDSTEITYWIDKAAWAIEILAVVLIVGGVFTYSGRYLYFRFRNRSMLSQDARYREYKHGIARWLLLGLEILVAADVIRTVALTPTLESIATLGLLVLVRTFLSWSLEVETDGRWPWQQKGRESSDL